MIGEIFSAVALLAATPPSEPSPLFAKDHSPDWVHGVEDDEHRIWIDMAYRGQFDFNGDILPTILVRSELFGRNGGTTILDTETIVDCSGQRTAIFRTWLLGRGTGRIPPGTSPSFSRALFREAANAKAINAAACDVQGMSQ